MRNIIHLIAICLFLAGIYIAYIMIYVDYKYTSDEMFDAVNAHREYIGVQTLEKDLNLCKNLEDEWQAIREPENELDFEEWLKKNELIKDGKVLPPYNLMGEIHVHASTPSNAILEFQKVPDRKEILEKPELNVGCAYAKEGTTIVVMAEKVSATE